MPPPTAEPHVSFLLGHLLPRENILAEGGYAPPPLLILS